MAELSGSSPRAGGSEFRGTRRWANSGLVVAARRGSARVRWRCDAGVVPTGHHRGGRRAPTASKWTSQLRQGFSPRRVAPSPHLPCRRSDCHCRLPAWLPPLLMAKVPV